MKDLDKVNSDNIKNMIENEYDTQEESEFAYLSKVKMTKKRIKFIETYNGIGDTEALKELLFAQQLQLEKLEKIRSNTSILAWWLVAIPIICAILFFLFGLGGVLL